MVKEQCIIDNRKKELEDLKVKLDEKERMLKLRKEDVEHHAKFNQFLKSIVGDHK